MDNGPLTSFPDPVTELTPKEQIFLKRQTRNANLYLVFSIVGIVAAVAIFASAAFQNRLNGVVFALIIVILLAARGNLKQHKDAIIMKKLTSRRGLTPGTMVVLSTLALALFSTSLFAFEPGEGVDYRQIPLIGSRVAIWVVAELHLMFAAFVLAVPMFALVVEYIGHKTKDKRYDKLAHEFTKLLSTSFSFTATLGALLTIMLIILYPRFTAYLMHVFAPTFFPYVLLFFAEAGFLYSYYYGWGKFSPRVHLLLGVGLNIVGTALMFIANGWLTFMTSPAGIAESGEVLSVMDALTNFTWMPINIHRLIANVAFGGSIAAAYAAFKFLGAQTDEEKAHYDWMGYIGNFIAISAFLPLPFAGYWLGKEIYAFSQNLGMTLMGGAFSWLFIIQAILIGMLFLGANFYLWLGMGRIEGAERYQKFIKYLLFSIITCFIVWATPHSLVATMEEARKMGGSHHPMLGVLGVMSAKNTAVNILILSTYISFLLYRRSGKIPTVSWAKKGNTIQFFIFVIAILFVLFIGVYGYFVEAKVRIGLSVPQVLSVLLTMLVVTIIDVFLFKNAKQIGSGIKWGKMPVISQYTLFFIAISFTWLMGLMGFVRSGLRQHWHVYGVMRDTSVDAFTPTLGFASSVTSIIVLIFFVFVAVVFWLASLSTKKDWVPSLKKDRIQRTPAEWIHFGLTRMAMAIIAVIFILSAVEYTRSKFSKGEAPLSEAFKQREEEAKKLENFQLLDEAAGIYQISIKQAMELVAKKYAEEKTDEKVKGKEEGISN